MATELQIRRAECPKLIGSEGRVKTRGRSAATASSAFSWAVAFIDVVIIENVAVLSTHRLPVG